MRLTHIIVCLFVAVLSLAACDAWAEDGFKIALGRTAVNSEVTASEVGYEYNDWELNIGHLGQGPTRHGNQDVIDVYSISKIVRPDWCFLGGCNFYRIGIAHIDDSPIVGKHNYRLGVGMAWRTLSVEYFHYSSAGTYKPNSGIDGIMLKLNIPVR